MDLFRRTPPPAAGPPPAGRDHAPSTPSPVEPSEAVAPRVITGVGPNPRTYPLRDDVGPLPSPVPSDGAWHPDVLGPGFVARTLPLHPDEEGEVVATLVAHRPAEDPHALPGTPSSPTWAMLYLHGWNDYVHNAGIARRVAALGGQFYGLDLRKYGRSLREHQTRGFTTSLSTYDDDIHAARDVLHAELGLGTDLVLAGHSTGGLTAALWAHRHPGALRGLWLNSPFIALGVPNWMGGFSTSIVDSLARSSPKAVVRGGNPLDIYQRAIDGLAEGDTEVPPDGEVDDPFWTGWGLDRRWRLAPAGHIRMGWLSAVLTAQRQVQRGLEISCPVLLMSSARSVTGPRWREEMRYADTVLDVEAVREAGLRLGHHVTIATIPDALHDVTLSAPAVRATVADELGRWVRGYVRR